MSTEIVVYRVYIPGEQELLRKSLKLLKLNNYPVFSYSEAICGIYL